MKLYHFTALERLPSIERHGIAQGDVPISITGGYNAPWFTADPNAGNQGWAGALGSHKTGLRLTVNIPDGDPKLKKWTDITAEEIEKQPNEEGKAYLKRWYEALNNTGSGGQDNWYVYHGIVPYKWVEKDELV